MVENERPEAFLVDLADRSVTAARRRRCRPMLVRIEHRAARGGSGRPPNAYAVPLPRVVEEGRARRSPFRTRKVPGPPVRAALPNVCGRLL